MRVWVSGWVCGWMDVKVVLWSALAVKKFLSDNQNAKARFLAPIHANSKREEKTLCYLIKERSKLSNFSIK